MCVGVRLAVIFRFRGAKGQRRIEIHPYRHSTEANTAAKLSIVARQDFVLLLKIKEN